MKQTFGKTEVQGSVFSYLKGRYLSYRNDMENRANIFKHFREGTVVYSGNIHSEVDADVDFFQCR